MTTAPQDGPVPTINVSGLNVEFRGENGVFQAVKDLSFHIHAGETLAVVGESGSGKSVSSLSVMRLIEFGGGRISSGEVRLVGRDGTARDLTSTSLKEMEAIRGNDVAMIFQEPMTSLNPVFTVGEQIAEAVRLHQDCTPAMAREEALRMLEKVRIPDAAKILDRHPHQLSGGMRQRVMIAMALSCKPRLLIADEPTTALDVTIQAQILQLIRLLQEEMGMAVLFITHDMGVVAEVADRVLVMRHGEKVEEGDVRQIFEAPQHPYTRALLAAVPKLGELNGQDLPRPFPQLREGGDYRTAEGFDQYPSQNTVEPGPPVLEARNLVTRFDIRRGLFSRVSGRVHAVENVSFDLRKGETLALVGESGCGKSTTGRTLMMLQEATSGSVQYHGKDIFRLPAQERKAVRRKIQYVFQDPFASLDPRLTVGFSIAEPLITHGLASGRGIDDRVAELLRDVGLRPEHAQRYPYEFSGGQRQRICIARALAGEPDVLITDEAVAALDVSIQAQVINLLMDLQRKRGLSYVFISHDMAVVERVSHRVAVMYLGQIVEIGPRRQIFENPQHPYTRRLLAAVPVASPDARDRQRPLIEGEIPSAMRRVDDPPEVAPLVQVAPGHFVARHAIGSFAAA
ncbi:dipeptide ABC transporter ATP-binding protein [Paracoccus seriniphilus]|uniref:Glutathione import ATP-binding protein GsiA n=1 Tax=Paracoccus seriniphilus TaxID=184748 RepID=A0A239PUE4_9RHOB|nr:dipeptide ABC transporter ATP-binding protein [Paracoccus seriniphilus]WCR16536.1 dipeptide ABC transporter ATP-binding protein [Paracoccus seriniphilus]SNT73748.1 glutathione transport system ATP-binding protein [Paracoccus seriniphilus]